jgi:hypothetical protein
MPCTEVEHVAVVSAQLLDTRQPCVCLPANLRVRDPPIANPLQELTKSMAMFGYDILQALVNDIAPDGKVWGCGGFEGLHAKVLKVWREGM